MEWYTTFKLCQDSHNYFTENNMYGKFSNGTIHDIVNLNEKVFSANKKSWLVLCQYFGHRNCIFFQCANIIGIFKEVSKYLCASAIHEIMCDEKTCELLRTLLYNNKLSMVRLGIKIEPIFLLLIQ